MTAVADKPKLGARAAAVYTVLLGALIVLQAVRIASPGTFSLPELGVVDASLRPGAALRDAALLRFESPLFLRLSGGWLSLAVDRWGLPPVLSARLPGMAFFFLLLAAGWWTVRRALGGRAALVYTVALAGSSAAARFMGHLDDLSVQPLLLLAAFLAWRFDLVSLPARPMAGLAALLLSLLAVWLHPVGWPAAFLIIACAAWGWTGGGSRRLPAFAVMALLLIGCLPLAAAIHTHWQFIGDRSVYGFSSPTVGNLLRAMWHTMPLAGVEKAGALQGAIALLAVAVPAGMAVAARSWCPGPEGCMPALRLARASLAVSAGHVFLCWLVSRLGLAWTFSLESVVAPVYPLWIMGLLSLLWSALPCGRRQVLAEACFLAPWLLGGALVYTIPGGGSPEWIAKCLDPLEDPGEVVVLVPGELTPWMAELSPRRRIVPARDFTQPDDGAGVVIADLATALGPLRGRDALFLAMSRKAVDSHAEDSRVLPGQDSWPFRLARLGPAGVAALQRSLDSSPDLRILPAAMPGDAAALAIPQDQPKSLGWSSLELGDDLVAGIWASHDPAGLVFDEGLAPGLYDLHVLGYRREFPRETVKLRLKVGDGGRRSTRLGPGDFHLVERVELERGMSAPIVWINHPPWSPFDYIEGSPDTRVLTFRFLGAWFVKVDEEKPAPEP